MHRESSRAAVVIGLVLSGFALSGAARADRLEFADGKGRPIGGQQMGHQ